MAYNVLELDKLSANTVILTPNHRIASYIRKSLITTVASKKKYALITPKIYSWQQWLQFLWQEIYFVHEVDLLTDIQSLLLWQQVILRQESSELLPIANLAKLAQDAWRNIYLFQVPLEECSLFYNTDVVTFVKWFNQYNDLCLEKKVCAQETLLQYIIQAIYHKSCQLPENILWVEFSYLPPLLISLQQALKAAGVKNSSKNLTSVVTNKHYCVPIKNETSLLNFVSQWAEFHYKNNVPRVGIIMPNIEEWRDDLEREFYKILPEDSFNVSAPRAMIKHPMIKILIVALHLNNVDLLSYDLLSQVILAPFIGTYTSEMRVALDLKLRAYGVLYFKRQYLQEILLTMLTDPLAQTILQWLQMPREYTGNRQLPLWIKQIENTIAVLHWPGSLKLIEEQQLHSCWHLIIQEYRALGKIIANVSWNSALVLLSELLTLTPFAREKNNATIEVLGLLEGLGLPFTQLLITDLDKHSWPGAPDPNPFIPLQIQKTYGFPRSTAEQELKFCQQAMEVFLRMSQDFLIFAYAVENTNENKINCPSTLLTSPVVAREKIIPSTKIEREIPTIIWEEIADTNVPLTSKYCGGSSVLLKQANCPFSAFIAFRLHAQDFPRPKLGLTRIEQGELIHKILEKFWHKIKTQKSLLAIDEEKLVTMVRFYINELSTMYVDKISANHWQIEAWRLEKLVVDWLMYEKKRASFKVLYVEKKTTFIWNNLYLSLRIDRCDLLADGKVAVIDYKTGSAGLSTQHWFYERLVATQLPLYAIVVSNVHAIAYGIISSHNITFKGLQSIDLLPDVKIIDWQQMLTNWQEQIKCLALEFDLGIATVSPALKEASCSFCPFGLVCRIKTGSYA